MCPIFCSSIANVSVHPGADNRDHATRNDSAELPNKMKRMGMEAEEEEEESPIEAK